MPKKSSKEEFILKSREVHGWKYDYSKVNYINNQTKVILVCPEHGEFTVRPSDHIYKKCGCKKCSGRYKNNTQEFIEKAKKLYSNKYDYSKVEYDGNKKKVCIICHEKDKFGVEHGEFWQRPNDHLNGYECKKCKNKYKPSTEEWIRNAKYVHGEKYDYSKVKYVDAHSDVTIICPEHGEFKQIANNHLNGCGCPNCNSNKKSKMEIFVSNILDEEDIKYIRQKTFRWLKLKRNLFLDFYIPYKKIAIEVMGEQHFRPIEKFGGKSFFEEQIERDKEKKLLCEEHGIKIVYITKKELNKAVILKLLKDATNKK